MLIEVMMVDLGSHVLHYDYLDRKDRTCYLHQLNIGLRGCTRVGDICVSYNGSKIPVWAVKDFYALLLFKGFPEVKEILEQLPSYIRQDEIPPLEILAESEQPILVD